MESRTPSALRAVRVGAFARPGQAVESPRAAASDTGMAVRLPPLLAGLRWSVQIEVVAGEAVTVCSLVAG